MNSYYHQFQFMQWIKNSISYWLIDPLWGAANYASYYSLRSLSSEMNVKVGKVLGVIAGHYFLRTQNKRAKQNLDVLYPQLSVAEKQAILHKIWQHAGRNRCEYAIADRLWKENRFNIEGEHYLKALLEKDIPVLFVFAHTGNVEVCGSFLLGLGFNPIGIQNPGKNRFVNQLNYQLKERLGINKNMVNSDSRPMRMITKHLSDNSIKGRGLWIAIDEGTDFSLARSTDNAIYAVRLAQRYNAAIVPLWFKRSEQPFFSITINKPIFVGAGEDAITDTLSQLQQMLRLHVMQNLEQWRLHLINL